MSDGPLILQTGQMAPAIEATITGDGTFSLRSHAGQFVAIYFFPRSNTPG